MTDKEKIIDILLEFYEEYQGNIPNRPMIPSIYASKIIDSLQEEPVNEKKCMFTKDIYTDEDRKVLCEDCKERCEYSKKEEPVSKDFEMALAEMIDNAQKNVIEPWVVAAQWKDELIELAKSEEPLSEGLEEAGKEWLRPQLDKTYANYGEAKMMELTRFDGYAMLDAIEFGVQWQKAKDEYITEDLGEYINELSKQFPEVSFAKLSRIAVRVAKWKEEQMTSKE